MNKDFLQMLGAESTLDREASGGGLQPEVSSFQLLLVERISIPLTLFINGMLHINCVLKSHRKPPADARKSLTGLDHPPINIKIYFLFCSKAEAQVYKNFHRVSPVAYQTHCSK